MMPGKQQYWSKVTPYLRENFERKLSTFALHRLSVQKVVEDF